MMVNKRFFGKLLLSVISVVLLLSLLPVGAAGAGNNDIINEDINKAAGNLEISAGTKINGNVTLNLGELTVYGVINGNVKNNIGQVNIEGDINGDVETNMGQVIVNGNVSGDVKTRMGDVVVDGLVGGNVTTDLGATKVGGAIGGDIDSGFGEMRVTGDVGGNVNSTGGHVIISGIVEGDVILEQGVVELAPDAVVSGKVYVGRGTVNKAETARVDSVEIGEKMTASELQRQVDENGYVIDSADREPGEDISERIVITVNRVFRDFNLRPHLIRGMDWPFFTGPFMGIYGNIARGILNMLILFALAALTYTLFPTQVKTAGNAISDKTGPVLGWGLLAAVLAIPLMVLLAITIIGIPLIFVEIIVLAAAALLGYTGIVKLVGSRVIGSASSGSANPLGAIALGVILIGLVSLVPIIGSLVSLAIFILGVGAALATRFGSIRQNENGSVSGQS